VRFISGETSAFTLIEVRAARAATPTRPAVLPTTGAAVAPLVGLGGLLVGSGLLTLLLGRRRAA
jgi:LPXTG-motif cell wall-anchored protein